MLKEIETEEAIGLVVTFSSLVTVQIGGVQLLYQIYLQNISTFSFKIKQDFLTLGGSYGGCYIKQLQQGPAWFYINRRHCKSQLCLYNLTL